MRSPSMSDLVDCNLRVSPGGLAGLAARVGPEWREYLGLDSDLSGHGTFRFGLPESAFVTPEQARAATRTDDARAVAAECLDAAGVARAVVTPSIVGGVCGLGNPFLGGGGPRNIQVGVRLQF